MRVLRHDVLAPPLEQDATALVLVFPPSRGRVLSAEMQVDDQQSGTRGVRACPVSGNHSAWRFPLEQVTTRSARAHGIQLTTTEELLTPAYYVQDLGDSRWVSSLDADSLLRARRAPPVFVSETTALAVDALLLDARSYANALAR